MAANKTAAAMAAGKPSNDARFGKIGNKDGNFGDGKISIRMLLPQYLAKLAKIGDWAAAAKIANVCFLQRWKRLLPHATATFAAKRQLAFSD